MSLQILTPFVKTTHYDNSKKVPDNLVLRINNWKYLSEWQLLLEFLILVRQNNLSLNLHFNFQYSLLAEYLYLLLKYIKYLSVFVIKSTSRDYVQREEERGKFMIMR